MRKLILMLLFVSATLLLVACGDDEEQVTDPLPGDSNQSEEVTDDGAANDATDDATNEEANNSVDLKSKYNFVEFNIEVDAASDEDIIDVEFDVDNDGTEAKYIDKSQDINALGNDAMELLDGIFTSFTFTEESTDEEIMNEINEAFSIPEDATDVDIDIEFVNGTEFDYEK